MRRTLAILVLGCAATAWGCGGAPPPVDLLASTQAAIRGAEEVGASQDPKAALHLKLAKEQVAEAKGLMDEDDNEEAQMLLRRAEADAELAHAFATKASTEGEAVEAIKDVERIKSKD